MIREPSLKLSFMPLVIDYTCRQLCQTASFYKLEKIKLMHTCFRSKPAACNSGFCRNSEDQEGGGKLHVDLGLILISPHYELKYQQPVAVVKWRVLQSNVLRGEVLMKELSQKEG